MICYECGRVIECVMEKLINLILDFQPNGKELCAKCLYKKTNISVKKKVDEK